MSDFIRQPVSYPVCTVFLDDSASFLSALRSMFSNDRINRFFGEPRQALAFVMRNGCTTAGARLAGREYSAFECGGGSAIGADVMEDDNRFQAVAAVVVDYEMPEIDGITFLSQLQSLDCMKILLTGAAGTTEAVEAFNAGLIDYYLRKSDVRMSGKLRSLLAEARRRHCMSRGLIGVHDTGAVYSRPETMKALDELVACESLVEYYWRPDANAVLTFDADGAPGIFLAWDDTDWGLQCDAIVDEDGPAELLDSMRARRVMPVFWPHQAYRSGAGIRFLLTAQAVEGLPGAFYSWTRFGAGELKSSPLTFAQWRPELCDPR